MMLTDIREMFGFVKRPDNVYSEDDSHLPKAQLVCDVDPTQPIIKNLGKVLDSVMDEPTPEKQIIIVTDGDPNPIKLNNEPIIINNAHMTENNDIPVTWMPNSKIDPNPDGRYLRDGLPPVDIHDLYARQDELIEIVAKTTYEKYSGNSWNDLPSRGKKNLMNAFREGLVAAKFI